MLVLTLTNFKCWTHKVIEIPKGVTLLLGRSGVGKTSICDALFYVITGKKPAIMPTYGKSSTKVSLAIPNLGELTRTNRPRQLTLVQENKTYEDKDAQAIVDTWAEYNFSKVSYLKQQTLTSFMYWPPSEKMKFFQNFCVQGEWSKEFTEKLKLSQKNTTKRYNYLEGSANTLKETLKQFERMKFSEKSEKETELTILEVSGKVREREKKLSNIENRLITVSAKISNALTAKSRSERLKRELADKNGAFLSSDFSLRHRATELRNEYEKLVKDYNSSQDGKRYKNEIGILKENVQDLETKIGKLGTTAVDSGLIELKRKTKEYIRIAETIKNLQSKRRDDDFEKKITDSEEIIKVSRMQIDSITSKQCPSCEVHLVAKDGKLVEVTPIPSNSTVDDLLSKVDKHQRKKRKYQMYKTNNDSVAESIKLEKRQKTLIENDWKPRVSKSNLSLSESPSSILQSVRYEINAQKQNKNNYDSWTQLRQKYTLELQSVQLRLKECVDVLISEEQVERARKKMKDANAQKLEHARYEYEILSLKKQLEQCDDVNQDDLKKMQSAKEELSRVRKILKDENTEFAETLCQLRSELNSIESKKQYVCSKNKLKDVQNQMNICNKRYENELFIQTQLKKILSEVLFEVLDDINEKAKVYIDNFFEDMSVNIVPITKEKNKIDISIIYKTEQCQFKSLSGGEQQRIVAAFALAISEMYNTPLLILDEVTSNLDSESTSIVMSSLLRRNSNAYTVVIAHQVVEGKFNNTISL